MRYISYKLKLLYLYIEKAEIYREDYLCTVRAGKTSPGTSWSNSERIFLTRKIPLLKERGNHK